MDDADEADRAYAHIEAAVRKMPHAEGPKPMLVTYCLFCEKPIERVPLEDVRAGRPIKRWCCIACRDAWEKEQACGRN